MFTRLHKHRRVPTPDIQQLVRLVLASPADVATGHVEH
jgi:hypothetical protein